MGKTMYFLDKRDDGYYNDVVCEKKIAEVQNGTVCD